MRVGKWGGRGGRGQVQLERWSSSPSAALSWQPSRLFSASAPHSFTPSPAQRGSSTLLHERTTPPIYANFIVIFYVIRNPHTSHLVSDTFTSPLGERPNIFASCVDLVYAAALRFVLFVARTNKKVLHSSHFLALRRLLHEECDSLATYKLSSTKAIKLKLRLSSSCVIMLRITAKHFSANTSSSAARVPRSKGRLRSPSS